MLLATLANLTSCNSSENSLELSPESQNFLNSYNENFNSIYTANILPKAKTRTVSDSVTDIKLSINFPDDTSEQDINLYKLITSIGDVTALHRLVGAEFSSTNTDSSQYSVTISETEVRSALRPLVDESKNYFKSKGFTNDEINQMLIEENADETDLAILALIMTWAELDETEFSKNDKGFNPLELFVTKAYAEDGNNYNKAFDCALKALGADLLSSIGGSSLKTWGKAAIKRAVKILAKKALGPIGAAICVAEFVYCMSKSSNNDKYITDIPLTPVEIEYNKIHNGGASDTLIR